MQTAPIVPGSYDLVALDVDGTLVNSQHTISQANREAVAALRAAGVRVALVTGRPPLSLKQWQLMLDLEDAPYIGSGGAYVFDPAADKVIDQQMLPPEVIRPIVEVARAARLSIIKMAPYEIYFEGGEHDKEELVEIERGPVTRVDDVLQVPVEPTKITLFGRHERLVPVEARLRALDLPIYLTYSLPIYLEATRAGVNKGSALKKLAAYLNIPLERILVMGDNYNDVSMFRVAGLAVAMGNAEPAVKEEAALVAPSNDEDGVAWTLRQLLP